MNDAFLLVAFLCLIAFLIGLIKPGIVIRWGEKLKRNRKNVLKIYGIGFIFFFVLFAVTIPSTELSDSITESNPNSLDTEEVIASDEMKKEDIDEKPVDTFNLDEKKQKDTLLSDEELDIEGHEVELIALNIDNMITSLGEIDSLTLDKETIIKDIRTEYELLSDDQKDKVTKMSFLEAAERKVNFLQVESEKAEEERLLLKELENEKIQVEAALEFEIQKANEGLTETDYKALCVDYPYKEITKDNTSYLDTYIKKDLMVRQIAIYTSTDETVYLCGEKQDGGSYVGGLFYLFDRRNDQTQPIELYDKIFVYGKVTKLSKVLTWDRSGINPYIDAVYIEFNGKFGE